MLKNNYFYHKLFRKYVIYFGSLFNDIFIQRTDANDNVVQWFNVPLAYGPKSAWITRLNQDPDAKRETAIVLPRMSFEITNIQYDAQRKISVQQKIVALNTTNPNNLDYTQSAIPYNITFALTIYTKTVEENLQIMEQIFPFFAPEWTASVNLIPELGITKDIPVSIANVTVNDRYENQIGQPRFIMSTIQFLMKAELYGPIKSKGIIKRTTINLYDDDLWNTIDIFVNSDNNPAFDIGDIIYQTNGKYITAQGVVKYSSNTIVQVMEVKGSFNTSNTLYSKDTLNRANVVSILVNATPVTAMYITPALTANGKPTNNSAISISIDKIKATDDYGISITMDDII
jgi:hypothetical protein